MKRVFEAFVIGASVFGIGVAGGLAPANASVPFPVVEQAMGSLAPMIKKITPAVVSIAVKLHPSAEAAAPKKPKDARHPANTVEAAADRQFHPSGSGVVIDARQGLIVTNNHVIDKADEITVTLSDGHELHAKLVGTDPDTDVAVLKVEADNLVAISIGDSGQLEVGDFVLAIGNPFMIGQTVTSGIVSGLNRNNVGIEEFENFIQTDAAIYPGNSGGALVNMRGEIIGMSTAFIGASTTNPGMGFAIPINMVRVVVDHILESGDVRRGRLGISFEDPNAALAREFKLASLQGPPVITKVDAGSSAEHAGLKNGDVVSYLGGVFVRDSADLRARLGLYWLGDTAEFTVLRDGATLRIRATMALDSHEQHVKGGPAK